MRPEREQVRYSKTASNLCTAAITQFSKFSLHSKNWRSIKLPTERRLLRLNYAGNQKNCLGN